MTHLADQIVESLAISNRVTLYLLEACSDEALAHVLPKGWGLAAQFAHIHNVRLMWLDGAKSDHELSKLATKQSAHSRDDLAHALEGSGKVLEDLVASLLAEGKRMPGFKPHTPGFVAYFVAHQAYHHAEIGVIAKDTGFPIDKKHAFGMWEWGAR
jgi:uncharacterized damage-inducible protein DinB